MAMLAEPRQRKRYILAPRGKALYEDDSRFGTKMLEKMGWSKGKGLGPKENGSQDFVRVRYKNDIQGLGFEHRDDLWTQHESSFSGLLKSLNGVKPGGEGDDIQQPAESEDDIARVGFGFQNDNKQPCTKKDKKTKLRENISGVSLEEKSKQSKARVHYKKFTRGKDISQYSEKDLANIFGKKAVDDQEAATADFYQQLNNNFNPSEDKEKEKPISENFGGVQTVSTGLSVHDYFKMKMAALKNRTTRDNEESEKCEPVQYDAEGNTMDKALKKKKKRKRIESSNSVDAIVDVSDNDKQKRKRTESNSGDPIGDVSTNNQRKKKAKHTKQSDVAISEKEEVEVNSESREETSDTIKKKKIKKRREHTRVPEPEGESGMSKITSDDKTASQSSTIESELNGVVTTKNIKSKKNKCPDKNLADVQLSEDVVANCSNIENVNKSKKKSKKRGIQSLSGDMTNSEVTKKIKRDDVSDPKELTDTVEDSRLQDIQANLNLFNVYRLSSFCAEKFRNLNLSYFPKSSLSQIEGYGLSQDVQLKIEAIKTDEMRITRLWDNTLSKYALMEKETQKAYQKYVRETFKARKHKQKRPSLHFKTWKRKNAFAVI